MHKTEALSLMCPLVSRGLDDEDRVVPPGRQEADRHIGQDGELRGDQLPGQALVDLDLGGPEGHAGGSI